MREASTKSMNQDPSSVREGPNRGYSGDSQLQEIRESLLQLDPEDLNHHLPNLVNTIRSATNEEVETIRFHIGVSFTQELTPLDYRIDQVIIPEGRTHTRIKSLKTAINRDHYYLSFPYPPDGRISASSLRGGMLAAVENEIVYSTNTEIEPKDPSASSSILSSIRDLF